MRSVLRSMRLPRNFIFRPLSASSTAKPCLPGATRRYRESAVKSIGERLMRDYVLPLEVVALLLTAALIGAVIIAMREEPK